MSQKIDQDHRRFREIVRGKIKQNLRKYISQGELLGRKGKEIVSIPIPQIDIPRFRFGDRALVSIEDRKRHRKSDSEKIVALLILIARADLKIGVLLGNFESEITLSSRVFRKCLPHVQPIQDRFTLDSLR